MGSKEMLFALSFFRTMVLGLRDFFCLPETTKVEIEHFKDNAVMRGLRNRMIGWRRGDWTGKDPTERGILRGRLVLEPFLTPSRISMPNRSAPIIISIGSVLMGSLSANLSPSTWFHVYVVLIRLGKYLVNDRRMSAVVE